MPVKKPFRVVFDTNIFISAIIFGGNPRAILELARAREIQLITSRAILLELAKKLHFKFGWGQGEIEEVVSGIGAFAPIVVPGKKVRKIKADPADNRVLEAALEARVEFIISGDKRHILPLKKFRNIVILSPVEFLKEVKRKRNS